MNFEIEKMSDSDWDEVRAIYERRYWRLCGAPALVSAGKHRLAFVTFDWSVNAGVVRGQTYVQASIGVTPDGMWGERTCDAIRDCDDATSAARYLALRADHYRARVGQQPARDGGLARARGRRQDEHQPAAVQGGTVLLRFNLSGEAFGAALQAAGLPATFNRLLPSSAARVAGLSTR